MAHKVGYYYHASKDTLYLVWRLHDWHTRNLAAKGIRANDFVVSREMTSAELEDYVEGQRRLIFTPYDHFKNDIENFLNDERACGVDDGFDTQLFESLHITRPTKRPPDAGDSILSPQSGESTPEVVPAATQRR